MWKSETSLALTTKQAVVYQLSSTNPSQTQYSGDYHKCGKCKIIDLGSLKAPGSTKT
jgi:hypothetical protein